MARLVGASVPMLLHAAIRCNQHVAKHSLGGLNFQGEILITMTSCVQKHGHASPDKSGHNESGDKSRALQSSAHAQETVSFNRPKFDAYKRSAIFFNLMRMLQVVLVQIIIIKIKVCFGLEIACLFFCRLLF